jgi:hypothetical protein
MAKRRARSRSKGDDGLWRDLPNQIPRVAKQFDDIKIIFAALRGGDLRSAVVFAMTPAYTLSLHLRFSPSKAKIDLRKSIAASSQILGICLFEDLVI